MSGLVADREPLSQKPVPQQPVPQQEAARQTAPQQPEPPGPAHPQAVPAQPVPPLVERAREGDRDAFEALLGSLRAELRRRIESRLGPRLRESLDPEDVLQDVQLRALRSVGRFRWQGEGSFRAWLEGIAAHVILDAAKTRERRRELEIVRDPPASGVSASRSERRIERFERLERSVEELPPDYRTAVRLARIEGLKVREVAERMGRSPASVRNLLFKAMKRLRTSFGDTESLSLPDRHLGDDGPPAPPAPPGPPSGGEGEVR